MRPSSLLLLCTASAAFQPRALRRPLLRTKETVADLDLLDVRGGAALGTAPSAMDEFVGEATGTALLLTLGYGAVASSAAGNLGLHGVACTWGVGVALGIVAAGDLSGAHLNPAITLALVAFKRFPLRKVPRYALGQMAGALAAAAFTALSKPAAAAPYPYVMALAPGVGILRGAFVEGLHTAVLAAAIFASAGKRAQPYFLGAVLSALICVGGPLTGAGYNPARDLAPRLAAALSGASTSAAAFPAGCLAVYTAGPVVGALVGGFVASRFLKS